MKDIERRDKRYEMLAWGVLLIWLGILSLRPGLPPGVGLLGIGAILVSLNVARRLREIPVKRFSTVLGAVAAVGGGVAYALHRVFGMPKIELPFFTTLLVALGTAFIVSAVTRTGRSRVSPAAGSGAAGWRLGG